MKPGLFAALARLPSDAAFKALTPSHGTTQSSGPARHNIAQPRVYISGAMTGLPDLNRPAFHAEAARLRALGHLVENPAEVALPDGATWEEYMRVDIPLLLTCTHIRMLDGWTMSRGARLEHHIAVALGLTVIEVGEVVS